MTLLLNGQAVKVLFGSTSVTCSFGSIAFSARAQLAPPKPPPITTTRGAACENAGSGNASAVTLAALPPTNPRRLMRWLIPMPATPYFCAASHAAIARNSLSVKPLAMRFMTVAGSEPSRKPVIAVMISPASRPYRRATGEPAAAFDEWQPEQDDAPGGGSEAASSGGLHATAMATAIARRNAFISNLSMEKRRPRRGAAARYCQAKVMFWSRSGTERIRLPV